MRTNFLMNIPEGEMDVDDRIKLVRELIEKEAW